MHGSSICLFIQDYSSLQDKLWEVESPSEGLGSA